MRLFQFEGELIENSSIKGAILITVGTVAPAIDFKLVWQWPERPLGFQLSANLRGFK